MPKEKPIDLTNFQTFKKTFTPFWDDIEKQYTKKYLMKTPIEIIICKMCTIVGADRKTIDIKKDHWYKEYSWTAEQEQNFTQWLADYLFKDIKARKAIMTYSWKKNKNYCLEIAELFVAWYGWKTKEKKE